MALSLMIRKEIATDRRPAERAEVTIPLHSQDGLLTLVSAIRATLYLCFDPLIHNTDRGRAPIYV